MSIKPPATIRSALKTALLKPPFNLIFKHTAGLGTILMYHRISAKPAAQFHPNNFLEVDTATFEKQLCFLKEHCLCLPLGEIVDRLSRGTLPPGTAAITFDDGYRDNLELALPLLSKYQLPATIYATTNFLDGSASPWWHELEHILEHLPALEFTQHNQTFRFELTTPSEKIRAFEKIGSLIKSLRLAEREGLMRNIRNFCSLNFDSSALMLSWPELERLSRSPLITIGAHTLNHPNLALCSSTDLENELKNSKHQLQEHLNCEIKHLAYPYGTPAACGTREFKAALQTGFLSAVTTRPGHIKAKHSRDLSALPRLPVNATDLDNQLNWKLKGGEALVRSFFE